MDNKYIKIDVCRLEINSTSKRPFDGKYVNIQFSILSTIVTENIINSKYTIYTGSDQDKADSGHHE